ncbi:hypothetical protein F0562_009375 [Nyssa sinensis]|uniref:NB-ARC domain-containing protein n=1 Tax=Nyssa sinensis TaxID=561372 RepID=A0A5J4ZZS2_9ASTE|nr:hypothetical protein F0562_009375 [Nyssa sinensis]
MADFLLSVVIQKAVEIARNLVIEEGTPMYWLREDVSWIERHMRRIQAFLKDADAKQDERENEGVANLINAIRDLAYDVEDVMDSYFPEVVSQYRRKGFLGFLKTVAFIFSDCYVAHNFAMKIEQIKRRVNDINEARTTYGIAENGGHIVRDAWDARKSFPHVDEPNVVGLGKTTLAKKVYNSVRREFDCSAWVFVSQEPTIQELLQDIAGQVGLEKEKREEQLEANLFNFLWQKRYVIVIDDIWDTQTWDALSKGIPKNSENSSGIIITSRKRDVAVHIGGQSSLHTLQPLDRENSKKLFFKLVMVPREFTNEITDPLELEKLAEQILDRCGGVPLAIVLTAAEGFIRGTGEQEVEEVGEDYLNNLIARNMIQVSQRKFDGRIKSCRIHDLLHNLCITVAEKSNFFNTLQNVKSNPGMRVRRVTIHRSKIREYIDLSCKTPKLRALLCFNGACDEIFNKHLKSIIGVRFLRVLRIESTWLPSTLPSEIGNLNHLSYLRLWGYGLIKLPSTIRKLKYLLTLDVSKCDDLILPDFIWNMKQLRHILNRNPYSSTEGSRCVSKMDWFYPIEVSLPNLQILIVPCHCLKANWLNKFTSLRKLEILYPTVEIIKELSGAMPVSEKLEKLRLMCDFEIAYPFDMNQTLNLFGYQNLSKLFLSGTMKELPSADKLPPNLTKLTLCRTRLEEDPMETLKKLPKLKILIFYHYSYIGTRMVCSGGTADHNFIQLEELEIDGLFWLEEIIVEEGGMPRLNKLRISGCGDVKIIPERLKNIMIRNL